MSFKHALTPGVNTPGGSVTQPTTEYEADLEVNLDQVVPVGTDLAIVYHLDVSQVKNFFLISDKDVTIETNSATVPADTLVLKANRAYIWNADSYDVFKFTTDITSLFITNAAGASANVKIRALVDPTV